MGAKNTDFSGESVVQLFFDYQGRPAMLVIAKQGGSAAREIGKAVAAYRAGPYDFSCSSCHGDDGKRIRMQELANISSPEGAAKSVQGWPGYRMTGGVMLTLQWRMNDCFRQQRFPAPNYLSDTITALITYLSANAEGSLYKGPGIKR